MVYDLCLRIYSKSSLHFHEQSKSRPVDCRCPDHTGAAQGALLPIELPLFNGPQSCDKLERNNCNKPKTKVHTVSLLALLMMILTLAGL